jgi:hypothetical protein
MLSVSPSRGTVLVAGASHFDILASRQDYERHG